ncbi:ribose transport system permease protein [Sporobacter termitidis DSM 10068]|uniref:Ribose transport system permease protein n=1 Tax=Sporobacter termitidis DSM 10068 TaxID=1123282 RepID=A0A1M5ZAQ2_9FIRM|nr:ABC transporter permease [Sporobacter termitidis]SHI21300.1 ribose transport system permease protein [Sporobacter termitidis DSM 10068]
MENRNGIRRIVGSKNFTLVVVWALIVILFQIINKNYLSTDNIRNIFNSAFVSGTIAVGMSCLLISGQIDLSAGNTGMMAGVIIAFLLQTKMPWVPALLITLCFGAAVGLLNAFFANVLNFMSFISTLAISTAFAGLSLVLTNAQNIAISNRSFWELGSTNVLSIFPLPFFITIILLLIYGFILSSTRFGRRIYMAGGNRNAARLAGINPKKITTILFVNNSMISCLAGALMAARMHMGSPTAITGSDLDAITAAVLGGVAFMGGGGGMLGVFIGLMLLNSFNNGLVVVGLDSYYQIIAKGVLLIAALTLDFYREKSRLKALKESKKAIAA